MGRSDTAELLEPLFFLGKWLVLSLVVALLAGSASALFLVALDRATDLREAHRWLIAFLPVAGFGVGWLYLRFGREVEAGNNLLIDEIHDPRQVVRFRMAPLILGGTVLSHLFGASVGREGTAVQMGGALADQLTHLFGLTAEDRRILLMAGIAAGFAAVFGTPLAGAVFALEVLALGRLRYEALFPCLVAALAADQICLLWGIRHTPYAIAAIPPLSAWSLFATMVAGALFGLAGRLFAEATHRLGAWIRARIAYAPLRPLLGGAVLAAVVLAFGADRYIGLGIPVIVEAFEKPLPAWDAACKALFTIASLGSGFKGGEVTPLFYIGATLGNALAPLLHLPFPLLAGLGFVAVFAGAANTPLASTLMAIEIFGAAIGPHAAIACVVAYLVSGTGGIYLAQRVGHAKFRRIPEGLRIGEFASWRAARRAEKSAPTGARRQPVEARPEE